MIIDSIEKIASLPSPALGFLPAVHDAVVDEYSGGALPEVGAGKVIVNQSSGAVTLPAFASWPPQKLAVGEFAGSDGRLWYPVRRYKATNSYYPAAFERVLYSIAFTPESFPLGTVRYISRMIEVRLLNNNTNAVWNFVWEVGMKQDQSSPAPTGPNLDGYVWRTPLIDQQLHLTEVSSKHNMGVQLRRVVRDGEDKFVGDVALYNRVVGALDEQLPTGNNFVLRLRLSCFDTQNDVPEPRGFVAYFCTKSEGNK
jgi:hypothetical protein